MTSRRTSTVDRLPADPVGAAIGATIAEILRGASVELLYAPRGEGLPPAPTEGPGTASAGGDGPPGWLMRLTVRLDGLRTSAAMAANAPLLEILEALPGAGLRTAARFSPAGGVDEGRLSPAVRRALRDTIVIEALSRHHACGSDRPAPTELIADTVEFLIELAGTRVEAQDMTHGVIITDFLKDAPRLEFQYPGVLRAAKRAPLLFDGQRSVLIVDEHGRARTELHSHRFDHLVPGEPPIDSYAAEFSHTGALVAEATRRLGGIGFFLRADRTIWVFADGDPLLMRRGERWTAFPLELATAIANAIGASTHTAEILARTAFIISAQRSGAILAIVDDPDSLAGVVTDKDRYDLRNAVDRTAMQTETRLHHLIDTEDLDAQTLARLAALDGATIIDRDAHLIAYGAIVTTSDSQFEGARTAAAKTLSHHADIVLKVSVDGDITVFRSGEIVATLLS